MRIIKLKESDELSKGDIERLKALKAKKLVYWYRDGGWDGSGFAAWVKGRKYFYANLGHCSCYGATDDLTSIAYTKKELVQIAKGYTNGEAVVAKL